MGGALMSEEDFASQFQGDVALQVALPKKDGTPMQGQTVTISVGVLDAVQSIKEKIGAQCSLAASKVVLNAPGVGFLKNDKSEAFYNLRPGAQLTMTVKTRGGR